MARNVKVTIDPPLPIPDHQSGKYSRVAQERLAAGISSIAPGRSIEWSLGAAHEILGSAESQVHTFQLTAEGPYGDVDPLEFRVDLSEWRESRDAPTGSLHLVRTSVDKIAAELEKIRKSRT